MKKIRADNIPPVTRRDRLDTMDNMELARFMLRIGFCSENGSDFCTGKPECEALLEEDKSIPEENCARCLAEWLGQESEI